MEKRALGWESALGPLCPVLVHLQGHWIQDDSQLPGRYPRAEDQGCKWSL